MELVYFKWLHPQFRQGNSDDNDLNTLIHPSDLEYLISSNYKSSIFCVIKKTNEFVTIKQLNLIVRVKESCLQKVAYEGLYLDDPVETKILGQNNSYKKGFIEDIFYHFKDDNLTYFIRDLENKKLKKRYKSIDLKKVEI